jgi:roadblock/LC7 domain-containing protein
LKKKTGIVVDEYGKPIDKETKMITASTGPANLDEGMFKMNEKTATSISNINKKKYTPINSYKPQGNLVYGDDLLSSLEDVFDK